MGECRPNPSWSRSGALIEYLPGAYLAWGLRYAEGIPADLILDNANAVSEARELGELVGEGAYSAEYHDEGWRGRTFIEGWAEGKFSVACSRW